MGYQRVNLVVYVVGDKQLVVFGKIGMCLGIVGQQVPPVEFALLGIKQFFPGEGSPRFGTCV